MPRCGLNVMLFTTYQCPTSMSPTNRVLLKSHKLKSTYYQTWLIMPTNKIQVIKPRYRYLWKSKHFDIRSGNIRIRWNKNKYLAKYQRPTMTKPKKVKILKKQPMRLNRRYEKSWQRLFLMVLAQKRIFKIK